MWVSTLNTKIHEDSVLLFLYASVYGSAWYIITAQ